jgi:hypothetical protein
VRAAARRDERLHAKAVASRIIVLFMIPAELFCLVVSGLRRWKRLLCGILASLPSRLIIDRSSGKVKPRRKNNRKPTDQELVPLCSHCITIQRKDDRPGSRRIMVRRHQAAGCVHTEQVSCQRHSAGDIGPR